MQARTVKRSNMHSQICHLCLNKYELISKLNILLKNQEVKMEYRKMGKTGLKVSSFCLGTMTFGRQVDEKESIRIIRTAIDSGVNFIDTADMYVNGERLRSH